MKSIRSASLSLILAGLWMAAPAFAAAGGNGNGNGNDNVVSTVNNSATLSTPSTTDAAAAITGSNSLAGSLATSSVASVKISNDNNIDNYNPIASGNAASQALQNSNINSALKTGTTTTDAATATAATGNASAAGTTSTVTATGLGNGNGNAKGNGNANGSVNGQGILDGNGNAYGFNTASTVLSSVTSSVGSSSTSGSQGGSSGSAGFVSPVPEPRDYALMLAGLAMLAAAVWNRRRPSFPVLSASALA